MESIIKTVEAFFLPLTGYKLSSKNMAGGEVIFYLDDVGKKTRFEFTVELDGDYINILLKKHIEHNPYEFCFFNYLKDEKELLLTLNFITNIYI